MSNHVTLSELDAIGELEDRHQLERGDYHDPSEIAVVNQWIKSAEKERTFLAACERASVSSALVAERNAKRANIIAAVALIVSFIAAHDDIATMLQELLSRVAP